MSDNFGWAILGGDEEESDDHNDDDEVSLARWLRADWNRRNGLSNQLAFSFEEALDNKVADESHTFSVASFVYEQASKGPPSTSLDAATPGETSSTELPTPGQASIKAASRLLRTHADELDDYLESQAEDNKDGRKRWRQVMLRETFSVLRLALIQAIQEVVKQTVGVLFRASSR